MFILREFTRNIIAYYYYQLNTPAKVKAHYPWRISFLSGVGKNNNFAQKKRRNKTQIFDPHSSNRTNIKYNTDSKCHSLVISERGKKRVQSVANTLYSNW